MGIVIGVMCGVLGVGTFIACFIGSIIIKIVRGIRGNRNYERRVYSHPGTGWTAEDERGDRKDNELKVYLCCSFIDTF